MMEAANAIVASPEVEPENLESLGFLSELISDSLGRIDSLKRSASTAILDVLENSVRLGWYLDDSRQFLIKEKTYVAWVEQTFPISYGYSARLRQLSRHFCRDAVDNDQRKKLGIKIKGLDEIGEHLRRQIAASQASSISDLYRFAGLLPAPGSHESNANGKPASSSLKQFESLLGTIEKRTVGIDPNRLTPAQRESLVKRLRPLANLYESLRREETTQPPACRFCTDDFR